MNFKFKIPKWTRDKFFNFKSRFDINKAIFTVGGIVLIFIIVFVFWWNREIIVSKNGNGNVLQGGEVKSSIAGLECERAKERPIAVMLAGDTEARPISGISQADMVFEMPVAPNGITRFMAVFQCQLPDEIGSIRSAREDFIPLAKGLRAIYAHWGGEHEALEELNSGIVDNIDGLKYENIYYYRKRGISMPHNGFTSAELLSKAVKNLSYDMTDNFTGYLHTDKTENKSLSNLTNLIIVDYQKPFDSAWAFDSQTNIYKRSRNSKPEVDKATNEQITAAVVIIMKTKITFWRDQYMRVDVVGQGDAQIYQGGIVINGKWKKNLEDSNLTFYDQDSKEIKFLPGKIWVEIVNL